MRTRVVFVVIFCLAVSTLARPCFGQSDEKLMEQLTQLMAKLSSSNDPCPYVADMRQLLNKAAGSEAAKADPETYKMIKISVDEVLKQLDKDCPPSYSKGSGSSSNSSEKGQSTSDTNIGEVRSPSATVNGDWRGAENQSESNSNANEAATATFKNSEQQYDTLKVRWNPPQRYIKVSDTFLSNFELLDGNRKQIGWITATLSATQYDSNGLSKDGRILVTYTNFTDSCTIWFNWYLVNPNSGVPAAAGDLGAGTKVGPRGSFRGHKNVTFYRSQAYIFEPEKSTLVECKQGKSASQ
ncbi:MAG: hypothetical protein JST84_32780 [Acidobacteria bacterium]|nr:hypothetical protein [Acidobacteriota bacterium]